MNRTGAPSIRENSGQAVSEYILLLAIVTGFYLIMSQAFSALEMDRRLANLVRRDFAMAYKYGNPKAKGFDEGSPEKHPRIIGGDNFRIFINPVQR